MTIDSEQEKASMRDKLRSEKVLQQTLQSINTDKKNVASDMRKSQNEMKRKLRKIRDRQREIQRSKSVMEKPPESVEEFLQNTKSFRKVSERRPMTSPPASLKSKLSGFFKPKLDVTAGSDDDDVALDPSFFTDQQKSKVDLRPKTAMSLRGGFEHFRRSNPKGRLGSRMAEERYFEEDEIADRAAFYNHLTNLRKKTEEDVFDSRIETKVGHFLGQSPEQILRRREHSRFLRQTEESVSDVISKKLKPTSVRMMLGKSPMSSSFRTPSSTRLKENQTPSETKTRSGFPVSGTKLRALSALQRGLSSSVETSRSPAIRIRPMSHTVTGRV